LYRILSNIYTAGFTGVGVAISRPFFIGAHLRAADSRPYGMTGVIPSCSCPRGIYYLAFFRRSFD